MVNTVLVCRNNAYLLSKEGVADTIYMLDRAIILGAFIVKSQAETVAVLACLIQSDSYIALEFHLYQTATPYIELNSPQVLPLGMMTSLF